MEDREQNDAVEAMELLLDAVSEEAGKHARRVELQRDNHSKPFAALPKIWESSRAANLHDHDPGR